METVLTVIPGAGVKQAENGAGNIFHEENQDSIDGSTQYNPHFF